MNSRYFHNFVNCDSIRLCDRLRTAAAPSSLHDAEDRAWLVSTRCVHWVISTRAKIKFTSVSTNPTIYMCVRGVGRKLSPAFESKPAGRVSVSFLFAASTGHHTNRRSFLCASVRPRIEDPPNIYCTLHEEILFSKRALRLPARVRACASGPLTCILVYVCICT